MENTPRGVKQLLPNRERTDTPVIRRRGLRDAAEQVMVADAGELAKMGNNSSSLRVGGSCCSRGGWSRRSVSHGVGVDAWIGAGVKRRDSSYLGAGEREVEDVNVLHDPRRVR